MGKLDEVVQKVYASRYKNNKYWGYGVLLYDFVYTAGGIFEGC